MATSKSKYHSNEDMLRGISSQLRRAAIQPNINGYIPHEKQVDFHSSSARTRLFIGGNRSGKTVAGGTELVWWLTGKHPYKITPVPPVRMRAVAVDFLMGVDKIVKPEIAKWLPPSELVNGSWEDSYSREFRTLTLANGSFVEFMSYDQDLDKFAGTSRHGIWFDEEPPEEIYNENRMRLIDTGGSMWFTMTPVEGLTWVYDSIYLAARTNPDIHVTEVDMTENPHIRHEEAEKFLADLTQDERKARIHGKFVSIGGLIYKGFKPEVHVIEPFIPQDDPGSGRKWLHVVGMDFGYNNPTAILWAAVDRDGTIFIYDEHYASGMVAKNHARRIHEKNGEHGTVPAYYVGDPSCKATDPITGTSIQIEYMEYGVPILPGNRDVKAGINRVARYLEGVNGKPRLYITQNCTNLLREIARYRWGQWPNKKLKSDRNRKEEPHKKDDHACDALRYLIASRPEQDDGRYVPRLSATLSGEYTIPQMGDVAYATQGGPSLQYDEMMGVDF